MIRMEKCFCAALAGAAIMFSGVAHATNFAILLSGGGQTVECDNISEVDIDDLTIDIREMTTGLDVEYRLYGPGQAHWGQARFSTLGGSKELQTWFQEAAKGTSSRKSVSIIAYGRDHSEVVRKYNFFECYPVRWDAGEYDAATGVASPDVYTVQIGNGTIEAGASSSREKNTQYLKVRTDVAGIAESTEFDGWQGGEPITHHEAMFNTTQLRTNSPGHKTVGEITLRGAMTDGRKGLFEWIDDSFNGVDERATLRLTEMGRDGKPRKNGKTYVYFDCFPTRYVFPRMSVTNTTGNVMEEVAIKPIRVELK